MNNNLIKTIYLYIICLFAFFVVLWGTIDTASALISYVLQPQIKVSSSVEKSSDYAYALDRLFDGSIRIIIPGLVFLYFSQKIKKTEQEKEK